MGGPNDVSREDWRDARKALVAELVRLRDQFDAGLGVLLPLRPEHAAAVPRSRSM